MTDIRDNMLTEFLANNGITTAWAVDKLDVNVMVMYRPSTRKQHAHEIQALFKATASKLSKFKFSGNHVQDFDFLKNECGVMHNHLGRLIGYKVSGKLNWRLQRGLSPEEQSTILAELSRIAQALKSYRVADEQQRAA